jgi:hypothetical protein
MNRSAIARAIDSDKLFSLPNRAAPLLPKDDRELHWPVFQACFPLAADAGGTTVLRMILDQCPVEFRPSPVHGTGGFATAVIQAGTRVIEYVGHKIEKHRSQEHCSNGNQYIFGLDENWDLDGDVEWNPARFLNHSCSPNCEAQLVDGRIWIVARQAIRPGEEITFNYGYDLVDYRDHPCQCKSPNCVGFMVAEELFYHVRAQQLDPS